MHVAPSLHHRHDELATARVVLRPPHVAPALPRQPSSTRLALFSCSSCRSFRLPRWRPPPARPAPHRGGFRPQRRHLSRAHRCHRSARRSRPPRMAAARAPRTGCNTRHPRRRAGRRQRLLRQLRLALPPCGGWRCRGCGRRRHASSAPAPPRARPLRRPLSPPRVAAARAPRAGCNPHHPRRPAGRRQRHGQRLLRYPYVLV